MARSTAGKFGMLTFLVLLYKMLLANVYFQFCFEDLCVQSQGKPVIFCFIFELIFCNIEVKKCKATLLRIVLLKQVCGP